MLMHLAKGTSQCISIEFPMHVHACLENRCNAGQRAAASCCARGAPCGATQAIQGQACNEHNRNYTILMGTRRRSCAMQTADEEALQLSLAASCQQLPEGIRPIEAPDGSQGSCRSVRPGLPALHDCAWAFRSTLAKPVCFHRQQAAAASRCSHTEILILLTLARRTSCLVRVRDIP